ncbi:unnamed protein product [Calypogeia fissa]
MGPEPATSKSSRGSRYRSNEAQANNHSRGAGDSSMDRGGSQRSETGKGKSDKDGTESGRGVKRRQHGGGGGGGGDGSGQGGTSGSTPSTHRSSKRWRGDSIETLDIPIPSDRWDGGTSDTTKENSFSLGKTKNDSEGRSGGGGEAISAKGVNVQSSREGGERDLEKPSRRQRVSKASLISDSRAITVMDLQETDVSIIDSNIRIKNKVSYRRESSTLEVGEPELLEKGVEENAKNAVESSRSRRRWDRDGHRGGAEVVEEGHSRERGNVGGEESQERERKKDKSIVRDRDREKDREKDRDRDRERDKDGDAEARLPNGRRSAEGSRDVAGEADGRLEASDELDISNDFKIQEELRNIELEKELENRIRRRREESGDRDRWRDDDRERDGKRHSDSRERDERSRDERERHRSRRDRERHSDRYESRQHREGSKVSEGRQREDRYYESDREYRSHREERYHGSRSKDLEEQSRGERNRDQDHRDRKGRDSSTGYEAERRPRDKGPKEDHSDRERSYPTAAYVESVDGARSEHRSKRVRESDGEGYGAERDHSRQRGRPGESDTITGNESVHEDRHRRNRDDREAEARHEGSRGSPRDNDVTRGKGKSSHWRKDGTPSEIGGDGLSSPRHDARGSPSSNRMDCVSSPHLDEQRSPRYYSQRSPSHLDRSSGASRGKTSHGDWFEPSNSASNSSGPQRRSQGPGLHTSDRRDRSKWNSEEEAKGSIFRGNRVIDEGRESSLSPHGLNDQLLPATQSKPPLHGQDSFPRGMGHRGMMESRGGWRGAPSGFDGGGLDHHGPDDLSPRDRNDRMRRMPMNRPPGSPMVRSQGPQMSSLPAPQLAPLPPPPPFRPGIDNPAVLGPMNGGFDEGGGSREQGRGDRKGPPHRRGDQGGMGPGEGWRGVNMGGWNSRNQGPLPGNGFAPFPPQFGHPPAGGGGFPGMGQQFPGPPMFPGGGGRPPMDMGFGGGRFLGPGGHMGEGGDGYLGPGRGTGWHGPGEVDEGRGPPLMGPGDGWEGPGPHGDERLRHGRMEWERGAPMGVRGWERDRERDMWEARRDGVPDFMPHRSQIDPTPQNQPFPAPGGGWGMPRDGQVPNELKPRQDRQPFDIQEAKRKPEGGPPKPKKPSGRPVSTSEGKLSKYSTATMQSVLSQLEISPDLAGPELYAQYRALLPPSPSGKQSTTSEKEDSMSELEDEDLGLEADPEGEAFIAGPNLLAKLLPPLPDGVFQEALRLYRKPETENRVQKSSRGSFVLPFDPSTIKVPSISMRLDRYNPGKAKDGPHDVVEDLRDHLEGNIIDAEFVKSNDETVNAGEKGLGARELEGVEIEDIGAEAMQDEFISSHVEVAEYSDREFEAEMEDTLEEDSLKDMQVGGALFETLNPVDEDKDSSDNKNVYKDSINLADALGLAKESLSEADDNQQATDAPKSESPVAEMEDPVYNVVAEADQVDEVVVEADQGDNVVVEADQVDMVVIEADQVNKVVVEADEVDKVVIEADQVDKMIVEGDQVDKVLVEADHAVKVVVEAYRLDNVGEEADQVGNVLEEADQERNVIDEAGQGDNEVAEVNLVDNMVAEADLGENVNSFVVFEGPVNKDSSAEPEETVVVEQELKTLIEETGELEAVQSSETLEGEFVKPQVVHFPIGVCEDFSLEALASKEVIEVAEDIYEEALETKRGTEVEQETQEAPASVEGNDQLKDVEEVGALEPMDGEGSLLDVKQGASEIATLETIQIHPPGEVPTTVTEDDVRMENNGKLKEIVESSPAPVQPAIEEPQPEPLTRLRKRRASSRLLAQQSAEAQVLPLQESPDRSASQGSVGVKKSRSRGSTRTSQRKSKRRGSTH